MSFHNKVAYSLFITSLKKRDSIMEEIFDQYNKSVGDLNKLKKKVKKIRENQPVKEKKPSYEPNDDGWITVHHKRGDKAGVKKRKKKEEERLVNFYSFEKKEAKLQRHKELLAKFEEDKKKLQKMREQRKFKI